MNEGLRTCKICGNPGLVEHDSDEENEYWWVECTGTDEEEPCGYSTSVYDDYDNAVSGWNSRPIEDALRAENERLREALSALEWSASAGPYDACPVCFNTRGAGHESNCIIGKALKETPEVKE